MSDTEYEAFEITDYDLQNEFNPNRSRRVTKQQQIYGIWAQDEDSDDDVRPSFGGSKKPKSYSAPIGFVAGGVQQAGKKDETPKEEEEEEDENDTKRALHGSSSSSDDEPSMSSYKSDILAGITNEIAGMRKKTGSSKFNPVLSQRGVGTWEKHTKGIGAKLLLQMGYQPGKGLGKDLQGIQAPIEAQLRKGRGAIGAYGPEKSQKIAELKPEVKKDVKKDGESKPGQWRKEGNQTRAVKYVYKSIEDVLDQGIQGSQRKREFSELSKVKVIDMTGPEQRVLSGYHAISGTKKPIEEWDSRKEKEFKNFQLPELLHNLNLLVEMCEDDIIQSDRALRYNEDRIVNLENEVANLQKMSENEETVINGLEHVLGVLERLTTNQDDITLDEVAQAYEDLQEKYPAEYMMYEVAGLAPGVVRPLLKEELSGWEPLREPTLPVKALTRWKKILEAGRGPLSTTPTLLDPYHQLVWDAWMPPIRIAVNGWDVKNPDPMLELLRTWEKLIPSWITDNILQQLIMPRIQHTADEWNPLTDTIPIHTWVHPWLPQLGKRLRVSVFPVIRQKLASALTSWHPSDTSARLMLQPWVTVFPRPELDAFLLNNILPKLAIVLQEFIINPAQQTFDNWNWAMDWLEVISPVMMAELLDKSFFPRWLQVLTLWLNMSPNYDQVTEWYSGWKNLLPPQLREQHLIKEHFRTALDLMSRSVGGPVQPPPPPPPPAQAPPPPVIHSDVRYQNMQHGLIEAANSSSSVLERFKELVQKRCEERGIVFLPIPNRYKEGKQVYRCGLLQMYIDRNVTFINDGSTWIPVSLQVLLDRAISGV